MKLALITAVMIGLAFPITSPAHANHVQPLVIGTPDVVTKDVVFKVNTNTNDSRLVEVCVYRTDINSPDVFTAVACEPITNGRQPISAEIMHTNEGMVVEIPYHVGDMIPGEDQYFGVKNVASVDGVKFTSPYGNQGMIPHEVPDPVFIVRAQKVEVASVQ